MINISRKDRSMLLFIAVALILFWIIFSAIGSILNNFNFKNSPLSKIDQHQAKNWLNTSRSIASEDLKNRIVIMHFFSQSCISCVQGLSNLEKFAKEEGNHITIIGINSPKFFDEKTIYSAKKAILRYEIKHPILFDLDEKIAKEFKVQEWPTYLLFDIDGSLVKNFSGSKSSNDLIKSAKKLIQKNRFSLNSKSLPIILEGDGLAMNVLKYPGKILLAQNFSYQNRKFPALIIANSGKNSVVITNLKGEIVLEIGSQKEGLLDGDFNIAQFSNPQGILYFDNKIYIADTNNHSLRLADLKTNQVKTVIGNGFIGDILSENSIKLNNPGDFSLNSPTDLEIFPSSQADSKIIIANSGANQLLTFNPSTQKISLLAGDGKNQTVDGKSPKNSLSQPMDLAVFNGKIYFLDALSSSIRILDQNGNLSSLAFGASFNGGKNFDENSLQSPRGIYVDDSGIYIADSLNHKIRKYDFFTKQISSFFGSNRGDKIGAQVNFDEPQSLVGMLDRFYIADTNNNRIVVANRGSRRTELLDIIPINNSLKSNFFDYTPNEIQEQEITVKGNQSIAVSINLEKGWKINDQANSHLSLIEIVNDKNAVLLDRFNKNAIKSNKISIPKLNNDSHFMLYGKIYYCQDGENSLCYIKDYQQPISSKKNQGIEKVEIKLGGDLQKN